MRRLRFMIAGRLFSLCLRVMPRGRLRDTLIEHVVDWRDERYAELEASS